MLISTRLPEGRFTLEAGPETLADTARMLPLQPLSGSPTGEGSLHAAWVEPVTRDGRLLYNLVVTVRPSELQRLVQAQAHHAGWIGTVMDSAGRIVARLPGGHAFVGMTGTTDLRQKLSRYHDDVDATFHLWADAWVTPGFEPMDANRRLPTVTVPVQAIQGEDDEYGSELQLGIIAGKVGGYCETRLIPDCGHSPHLQQPQLVTAEIARFVAPLALTV